MVPETSGLALRPESGPTESAALDRQDAVSFSCRGKDGIAERGQRGRKRGLSKARGRVVRFAPEHFSFRRLPHALQWMIVEVGLLNWAIDECNLHPQTTHPTEAGGTAFLTLSGVEYFVTLQRDRRVTAIRRLRHEPLRFGD